MWFSPPEPRCVRNIAALSFLEKNFTLILCSHPPGLVEDFTVILEGLPCIGCATIVWTHAVSDKVSLSSSFSSNSPDPDLKPLGLEVFQNLELFRIEEVR